MHIPDGFLSPGVVVTTDLVAAVGWGGSLRRLPRDPERIPRWGVAGAALFAVQAFAFPLPGGTSAHFSGVPLVTLLLGPGPALFLSGVVLFLQAILFGHGGLLTWGANFLNLGAVGVGVTAALVRLLRSWRFRPGVAFLAGALALPLGAALAALELGLSGTLPLVPTLGLMVGAHLPVGLAEGLLTAGAVRFFAVEHRLKPEVRP